jgi:transposase-like protein
MPMNRVQFQKGLSLPEFMDRYGTEQQCEQALIAARWPGGFVCPECGVMQSRTSFRREGRLYWQCAGCQHQCSLTSGTVFEATKLPLTRWFLAMQLLTQAKSNVSALELKRQLGVSYRSAWLMKHKLLEAMRRAEAGRELTGRVEIDDAYLGGERSGGKAGRHSDNKVPFVVAVQTTEEGRAHLACLSARPFTKEAMKEFIAHSMGLPLTLVSDGLGCFTVAASMGAVHDREITGGGKASVLNGKFRAINTLIGNVKTALAHRNFNRPLERPKREPSSASRVQPARSAAWLRPLDHG